jgi:hypothetical protein
MTKLKLLPVDCEVCGKRKATRIACSLNLCDSEECYEKASEALAEHLRNES